MRTDVIQDAVETVSQSTADNSTTTAPSNNPYSHFQVIRRNGKTTSFDPEKIKVAMTKAFLEVEGGNAAASSRVHQVVDNLTDQICTAVTRRLDYGGAVHIEDIQDQVELVLMRNGEHKVARAYVLYREEHARARAEREISEDASTEPQQGQSIRVTRQDGTTSQLDVKRLQTIMAEATEGLEEVDGQKILDDAVRGLFDGMSETDVCPAMVMSARTRIEQEPNYSYVAARLLLDSLRAEALSFVMDSDTCAAQSEMKEIYPDYFKRFIGRGIELELLDSQLATYDLEKLSPDLSTAYLYTSIKLSAL